MDPAASGIDIRVCVWSDLPVRDSRDGSRERLHAGAHVARPLPGCRSSNTFSDGAHSSECRRRAHLPLDRCRRRQLSHAATLRGRYTALHAVFTPTLDNQLSKKATEFAVSALALVYFTASTEV